MESSSSRLVRLDMSGRDHSDDSSGNLAAGDTVQDLTVDSSRSGGADPNDTQQDPFAAKNPRTSQNITNDPASLSNATTRGDTMDDSLEFRQFEQSGKDLAGKRSSANQLDETIQDPHRQQQDAGSQNSRDTTTDLLRDIFQSAILSNSAAASHRKVSATNAAGKPHHQNQSANLFDGRFELLTELGAGGMGTVFKAHDRELDRVIAIKVLSHLGNDADARVQRFRQEARAAAKLNHPNIIKIHDLHTANTGERYIQFEYVEGCSLSNLLIGFENKRLLMPIKAVLDCAIQTLAALDCMHEHNIVHRDVKPANIMLENKTDVRGFVGAPHDVIQDGARTAKLNDYPDAEYQVKLVDFGLAKIRDEDDNTMMSITRKGQAVGTAAYMSPEQCSGERVDGCSDIYSFGCILFEMLTGHVPFRGADSAETMRLHLSAPIPQLGMARPDLIALDQFERIVNRMLAKERIDRYQKAAHAKDELKELYIGIKSGALMEALQTEKGKYVTNSQSVPSELHPGVPKVGGTGGDLEQLDQRKRPVVDPTLLEIDYQQPQNKEDLEVTSREADMRGNPQTAERKIYADPLAPDATVQEGLSQGRKVYPDPLALDATQPSVSSPANARDARSGASAGSINTNWDPVDGSAGASLNSKQSTPVKKKAGQGFSEGDLFARKYEIKGHIGQGGMGVVYKAIDLLLGRPVAIKFLKGKSGISQMEMSRFQQEAKAIASLDHTNIIRVHEMSVTEDGDPYFVLEYVEGHALSSEIRGKKQLPLERALSIVSQVCDALQHAHNKGVIHRDIKPSNLMIVPQEDGTDVVKLLDFGIAKRNAVDEETLLKLTKTGELFGSPHYMSPEQCNGKDIGGQSDIYSLGVVLFELICGVPPFSGQSPFDTLDKHKNAPTPSVAGYRPDLPNSEMVDELLGKMMAKEPSERIQQPQEVKVAIQAILKNLEVDRSPALKLFMEGQSVTRKKATVLTICCIITLLGLVAFAFSISSGTQKQPNMVAAAKALKSWRTYDLNGQLLFDQGAYDPAEKQFSLAVETTASEIGESRLLHLNTSLRELRILFTATGNREKLGEVNGQLIETEAPTQRTHQYSWSDVSSLIAKASTDSDLDAAVERAMDVVLQGDETVPTRESCALLLGQVERVEQISRSERTVDQLLALNAYQCYRAGLPLSAKTSAAVCRLLNSSSPEQISPGIARLLVFVGLKVPNPRFQILERYAEHARQQARSPLDRLKSELELCEIYRLTDRRALAVKTIERSLLGIERLVPRKYWYLSCALAVRADLYSEEHKFSAAIPLLRRAIAIRECEEHEARSGRDSSDDLKSSLAHAYAGTEDGAEKAEKILITLIENQNVKSSRKAAWLGQLGGLYLQLGQLEKSETALRESIGLFRATKQLTFYDSVRYKSAIANLQRVQKRSALPSGDFMRTKGGTPRPN